MKVITLVLAVACCSSLFAQSIVLFEGIATDQVVYSLSYSSIDFCAPGPDITLDVEPDLGIFFPDEISFYWEISAVEPSGTSIQINGMDYFAGDTLSADSGMAVSFFAASSITAELHLAGTPSTAGEEYACSVSANETTANCNNLAEVFAVTSDCSVSVFNGIGQLTFSDFSFGPNPASDKLRFQQPVQEIAIYSLTGQLIQQWQTATNQIDISHIATGNYLLRVQTDANEWMTEQLGIQH